MLASNTGTLGLKFRPSNLCESFLRRCRDLEIRPTALSGFGNPSPTFGNRSYSIVGIWKSLLQYCRDLEIPPVGIWKSLLQIWRSLLQSGFGNRSYRNRSYSIVGIWKSLLQYCRDLEIPPTALSGFGDPSYRAVGIWKSVLQYCRDSEIPPTALSGWGDLSYSLSRASSMATINSSIRRSSIGSESALKSKLAFRKNP